MAAEDNNLEEARKQFEAVSAQTKDLAALVGPEQPWETTEAFLATLDEHLAARLA